MIGIYDSGLGGLTALSEARSLMPDTDFIYFGDTAHLPYGTRSDEAIIRYARDAMRFFEKKGVDAVLCACGTVSSVALDKIKGDFPFRIIGVVEPSARTAVLASKNKKIAVSGTGATVKSGIFKKKIQALCPSAEVFSVGCDLFVAIVENGFADDEIIATEAARRYLSGMSDCDTLILGCTHFPLLSDAIRRVLPKVTLISSGKEGARALSEYKRKENGRVEFYLSDTGGSFATMARVFLGYGISPIKKT